MCLYMSPEVGFAMIMLVVVAVRALIRVRSWIDRSSHALNLNVARRDCSYASTGGCKHGQGKIFQSARNIVGRHLVAVRVCEILVV